MKWQIVQGVHLIINLFHIESFLRFLPIYLNIIRFLNNTLYKEHIIRDILIDDKQALSEVKFNLRFPVKAVILIQDYYAFAKIKYDEHNFRELQKNL